MTRVEKHAAVEERLREVKGEVVRELKRERKRFRPFLTCGAIFVFACVGALVWAAWSVAASGLIEVPMLSGIAFERPAPARVVQPGVPIETVVEQQLGSELTGRLQQGNGSLPDRSVSLTVSEGSLTASLRSLIEGSGVGQADAALAQVALDKGRGIELFIPIKSGDRATALLALVNVTVEDGRVALKPVDIRIGRSRVPGFIVRGILQPLINSQFAGIQNQLDGYARIEAIDISQGSITLRGELSVELLGGGL